MSFRAMADAARDALKGVAAEQYTQAIVLMTSRNNLYSAVIHNAISEEKSEERELLKGLESGGDTEVCKIVCMWHEGSIDLPSYDFRKMLLEMNRTNLDAEILLMTDGGYAARRMAITMMPKDL